MTITKSLKVLTITIPVSLALAGCAKADKAACSKMVNHDWGIVDEDTKMSSTDAGKKMLEEFKAKSLDGCVDKWATSRVECHMNAKTTAEMSACDPKK